MPKSLDKDLLIEFARAALGETDDDYLEQETTMTTAKDIGHGTYHYGADGTERYVTYGPVRGIGPVRNERRLAEEDRRKDQVDCKSQGGYSDRNVYEIDADGYLREIGTRMLVWPPHGRSTGAVKIDA